MAAGTSDLSIIVPVFQGEATLEELVNRLADVCSPRFSEFEVILVNDGSVDGSWEKIVRLSEVYSWVTGIDLSRNFGQHNALLCGIRAARYSVTVTMDDDLQHPPEEIPRLVDFLHQQNRDVVYGTPEEERHSPLRNACSVLVKRVLRQVTKVDTMREVSALRAFRTELASAFSSYSSPYVSVDVLLAWATGNFGSIAVPHELRTQGVSNYTIRSLFRHALNLITGFSLMPLRVATISGFAFSLFGGMVFAYVLIRYFTEGGSIPGFPFLASIIAIFSGVQLFALGVIGEYLGRMYVQALGRPAFVIRSTTREHGDEGRSRPDPATEVSP